MSAATNDNREQRIIEIKRDVRVGDRVRSFDFAVTTEDGKRLGRDLEGERACYVEGVVSSIEEIQGCDRYVIEVSRRVFGGEVRPPRENDRVIPPVNGTPTMSRDTDFVEVIFG